MDLNELRTKYKPAILEIATRYGIENIRVFGSVARGEAKEGSDVDLLVKIPATMHLFDYVRAEGDLGEIVSMPVQMVSDDAVDELLRDRIFLEAVPL